MDAVVPPGIDFSADSTPWVLSVVVPACNARTSIESTLARLTELPGGPPLEILVVENGSDDGTWDLLERVQADWDRDVSLITLRSERGIGTAYRTGVAASSGSWVLLTADDLPFGSSDVEAVLACRALPRFAIGSKAHPRSRIARGGTRRLATIVFRTVRRAMLGLDVGDTQGTFVIEGTLARQLVAATTVRGFGMTTELVALAADSGEQPIELPVVLSEQVAPSRIRWVADGMEMMISLVRLRRRLIRLRENTLITTRPDAVAEGSPALRG